MNLLLVAPEELDGSRVVLEGRRAGHVSTVLGAHPGDTLRVGLVGGGRGRGVVVATGPERIELEVDLDRTPPPVPRVSIVLAVPRPKVVGRALEAVAASGVARIDLTRAWRVERAYLASPRLAPEALAAAVWLGCEQGGFTHVPKVALHPRLMALLEHPPGWPDDALRLVAHPRAGVPLEAALAPGDRRPVVLAIGPEGGFIDRELATFAARGFQPVSLAAGVLRTEHALVAALAQIELLARLTVPEPGTGPRATLPR